MTNERLLQLIEAYGADVRRWPAQARPMAECLLAQAEPIVRQGLSEAGELDRILDAALPATAPTEALAARILASVPRRASRGLDRGALAALAACAVLGVVLGYGGGTLAPVHVTHDEAALAAFDAAFAIEGWLAVDS